MFIRCLEVSLQVPRSYPCHKPLRSRFISLVHRLTECLSAGLLPYLPPALEVLINTQARAGGGGGSWQEWGGGSGAGKGMGGSSRNMGGRQ